MTHSHTPGASSPTLGAYIKSIGIFKEEAPYKPLRAGKAPKAPVLLCVGVGAPWYRRLPPG